MKRYKLSIITFLNAFSILTKEGNIYCYKQDIALNEIVWYKIPEKHFQFVINNIYYFPTVVAIKLLNGKYFIGSNSNNKVFLSLSLKSLNKENKKLGWVVFKNGIENIVVNKLNPNILGYSLNSESKAIYEYLERACSFFVDQNKEVINTKLFNENLKKLTYEELGFSWDNNTNIHPVKNWVKAKSIFQKKSYLVPYNCVYYGNTIKNDNYSFGSSNGTALGISFMDAYKRALYEFVERDILISAWMNKGVSLLKVKSNFLKLSPVIRSKINIYIYDKKVDNQYIIWCFLKNLNKNYYSTSGFAVHKNLKIGVEHAIEEGYGAFLNKHDKKNNKLDMIEEYYSDRKNSKKIGELYKKSGNIDLNEISMLPNISTQSLYSDIIYKDITISEILDLGFHCVKVFGLGGNSMYFNYDLVDSSFPKYLPIA